ncbi:hypothetical protein [Parapedobacter koreensis]|uniref:Outer membrane protein beta-barrel domain-containing protein n=1 Tax=Parapedobacter koreensis TaxID=332977 RepID=A0A1H7PF85_9SPHI|nr:hypothetical protein [Parapedobacter koreensis]SEL34299.1 hypothetical protein SAMN05421740_104343 [Parapedobacter koreensis]
MNESEENKELIQRMAAALRNHEESYREGAWERFSAVHGKPKPKVLRWPYWSAAAVVLLATGLFWFNWKASGPDGIATDSEIQQTLAQRPLEKQQMTTAELSDETEGAAQVAVQPSNRNVHIAPVSVRATPIPDAVSVPGVDPVQLAAVEEEVSDDKHISSAEATGQLSDTPAQRLAAVGEQDAPDRMLGREAASHEASPSAAYATTAGEVASDGTRKWNLGVMVAPSLTSEKVNWGGGIAIAYQLSDKFSVGSGVSIGQLGVSENPNYEPRSPQTAATPNMPSSTDGHGYQGFVNNSEQYKEGISVTSSVVTLDIPIDLRYEVARGFYTSVGVSYVAVLNEQRTSHFVGQLNERTFGESNSTHKNLATSMEVVSMSERTNEQPLEGKGYAGFMNFSIGRKVPLSKKLSLSVEPYFKLPIGRLSKEEMNFTNGGIRIVTGF